MKSLALFSLLCLLISSFSDLIASTDKVVAHAELKSPTTKNLSAHFQIVEMKDGFNLKAEVRGLKAGSVHGFHVHENNECKGPDFKSAGGHFNPQNHIHNSPGASLKHLGDLGNLVADSKGMARTEVFIPAEKGIKLSTFLGKAVIIHAKPDDQVTQPSGDSGDRIACGLIKEGDV